MEEGEGVLSSTQEAAADATKATVEAAKSAQEVATTDEVNPAPDRTCANLLRVDYRPVLRGEHSALKIDNLIWFEPRDESLYERV